MTQATPPLHVLASVAEELPPFYVYCKRPTGLEFMGEYDNPCDAVKARYHSVAVRPGVAWIQNAHGLLIGDMMHSTEPTYPKATP